ncbi:MAG: protein kinase, partial [Planctomycetes bacterium]|nr:protein kinase [Planctomycetota bacterium]
MQLNPAARELIFKVVYYGPGMAGKTTNLAHLQAQAPAGTASELQSVDTHSERTLHFDLLATSIGQIQGNNVRVEFHTVPGQSYYAATRRQLLVGADAVVFVADSRREALDENIASMNEMLDNLRQLGMPSQIPVVLQYNKQDLPTAVRPEQLNPLMNVRNWPSRGACAASGEGVSECASDILAMLAEIANEAQLPQVAVQAEPRSWLISCHRCQAMLEVPDAAIGSIYTCGVCSSALEVVDPDRGLTREPQPGRSPVALKPADLGQQQRQAGDPSDYAMKTLPVQQEFNAGESALQRSQTQPAHPTPQPAASGAFPLPGWEVLTNLDESPQGRRMRVRDSASGRICRAMVLSPTLMSQQGYRESLEPYVRLAGPLKHPHILPLLELRTAGEAVVLLSADVPEHEPLGVVLGRRRALAPPHAMGILRQVVLALEDAARQGVVHGWLRPECILVSPDGTVLVDEFAVPKNHRFLVRELAGASAATEYYLAPEHLGEDARTDLRSDMFLCGALLYRMITGDGLVTGYNAHEALHKLMAGGGKPLRSVGNSVSRDLDLFYRQLTALNRSERFESYRMLVEVLDRFGGGAKRQNLRLTQAVQAPPGTRGPATPGSGTQNRSGTGAHQRTG